MRRPYRVTPFSSCSPAACVWLLLVLSLSLSARAADEGTGQDPHWIWSPEHKQNSIPHVSCYFRKPFVARAAEKAQITISGDDTFELFMNGRRVGEGDGKNFSTFDVTSYLEPGDNLVAVKVSNTQGSAAGLAARLMVKERVGSIVYYATDTSWKVHQYPLPLWNTTLYNDSRWAAAQSFGLVVERSTAAAAPSIARQPSVASRSPEAAARSPKPAATTPRPVTAMAASSTRPASPTAPGARADASGRFTISPEFDVQTVLDGEQTGSLIAMAFNEFGQLIAAREGGPLLLIYDGQNVQRTRNLNKVRVYCDLVKNCQGILALNGEVYVTAEGPDGTGLYRLTDENRDGRLEKVRALIRFKGEMGEHGPHGIVLGPDGLLYVIVGNHAQLPDYDTAGSPYHGAYDGDLVQPRYEDPSGHAAGIKAPGGVILRTDIEGGAVQLVAGGLRNAYDLAFTREGDLFTHDSDMESDQGTTWYRPTRVYHVTPGAEFGWRSGWAKWPSYYFDCLPEVLDTGRGSPTGAVVYNHHMYPSRYHNALFLGDWSEGRILAVRLQREGASFRTESETFLQGKPLNVTDLAVGPDGWLYFTTGGRGTSGGIYRISWVGQVPKEVTDLGQGISAAIRQPQLDSAWGRQSVAGVKRQLGNQWDQLLVGVVRSTVNPSHYRNRALDLMHLFGPAPDNELLKELARDEDPLVRGKVTDILGVRADAQLQETLVSLLDDHDGTVRRKACEALMRAGQTAPLDKIYGLLISQDRFEAWAARRLLERHPAEQWREAVLTSANHRLFLQGSLALLIAEPTRQNALDVLERVSSVLRDFISDPDFIDMLRVTQVAMLQGQLSGDDIPELREQWAEEFPASHAQMNREMIRLLAHLRSPGLADRYLAYLRSNADLIDRLHVAMHLQHVQGDWTTEQKFELLEFYEQALTAEGGDSYPLYIMYAARDLARSFSQQEIEQVLARATRWPNAALAALYHLPPQLGEPQIQRLITLDRQLQSNSSEVVDRLKTGVVAVLSRSGSQAAMTHLRTVWDQDPQRRPAVVLGLMQQLEGENWQYVVRTLPVVEGPAAREILTQLAQVERRSDEPEALRNVILQGLALKEQGANAAVAVLEHWTGEQPTAEGDGWESQLEAWQKWYQTKYPNEPTPELPESDRQSPWQYAQLVKYLDGDEARNASAQRGAEVFVKAQCAKCHRYGQQGESMGPDLTTVSKRFMRKEILQSIIYPSHVISDQYAAKVVITSKGRPYTGIVSPPTSGLRTVLQADGTKVTINEKEIQQIVDSKVSAMPAGLIDTLTLEEIAELFAYLSSPPDQRLTRQPATSQR